MQLSSLNSDSILDLKISELKLNHSFQKHIDIVSKELRKKEIIFNIKIYPSTDWFVANGHTSIAFPFYLLHPKLTSLQKSFVGFSEGDTKEHFLKLLRHEVGHAIDNSFKLKRVYGRVDLFGKASLPYPTKYSYNPYSRSYVKNIEPHYGQSHPTEDFAETFAVWLDPKSSWKSKYKNWPIALKKLQYMDQLMKSFHTFKPKSNSATVDHSKTIELTVRKFLNKQASRYKSGKPKERFTSLM